MKIEELFGRLQGVRRNGNGWLARCPAHEDRNPSLSIHERDGKILLHCFAACSTEVVCQALGIKMTGLFSEQRKGRNPEPQIVRDTQKHLAGLRGRLTPRDRERGVTVVLTNETNLNAAFARALALAVEGELVQVAFDRDAQ